MPINTLELNDDIEESLNASDLKLQANYTPGEDVDVIFFELDDQDTPQPFQVRIDDDGFSLVDTSMTPYQEILSFTRDDESKKAAFEIVSALKSRL